MKERISNLPDVKSKRRVLRNNSTPLEVILWSRLRNNQLGFKFRRQHSFGKYIVDFYCREKNLIIEIDGSQHLEQENYDSQRTRFFESRGFQVLRFWNNEINTNINGVIQKILSFLNWHPLCVSPSKEGERENFH